MSADIILNTVKVQNTDSSLIAKDSSLQSILSSVSGTLTVAPVASENHLGEIGGNVKRITPTVTNTIVQYNSGQIVGGLIELQNVARVANGTGMMTSARLGTKISNSTGVQFDLIIFSAKPTGTYTDNTTFTINASDLPLVSKVYHINDWTQLGASASHGQAPSEPRFFQCSDNTFTTSLFALIVIRGSLTFLTTSDLALSLSVQRN